MDDAPRIKNQYSRNNDFVSARGNRSISDVSVTEQITPDTVRTNILAQFIAVELQKGIILLKIISWAYNVQLITVLKRFVINLALLLRVFSTS